MRAFALVVVVAVALASGCLTPKSYIEIPACANRVEVEGEATRLSTTRFELDHTFDLPFSKTEIELQDPSGGAPRDFEIVDSQPDALRAFLGAAVGVVGGLLLVSAAYNVGVEGAKISDAIPFYETIWGGGMVVVGTAGVITGWHPARRTFAFPDDVCPDQPRKKAPRAGIRPRRVR
ncbi:MAG TPA: hypothetical protein VGO62_03225 [Myxococcota bacterium]|jgi:hypothetical protein